MIWLIIISGILFTAGSIVKDYVDEPKLFFVPLAVMLWLLIFVAIKRTKNQWDEAFMFWLLALASGNFIKQLFYSDKFRLIMDYGFGGLCTIVLLAYLFVIWQGTRKKKTT